MSALNGSRKMHQLEPTDLRWVIAEPATQRPDIDVVLALVEKYCGPDSVVAHMLTDPTPARVDERVKVPVMRLCADCGETVTPQQLGNHRRWAHKKVTA